VATTRVPVHAFLVVLYCEECGARMHPTGMILTTMPPKYPHKCQGCGYTENQDKKYPYLDYDEENV